MQSGSLAHSLVGSWNKLVFSRWITQEFSVHANVLHKSDSVGTSIYLHAIGWCDTSDFQAAMIGGNISALLQCGNQETIVHSCCLPLGEFLWLPCSYSPLDQSESICPEGKPCVDLCVRSCEAAVFHLWSCDREQLPWALDNFSEWVFTSSVCRHWQQ